jgi:hypothetical protein
VRVADHSACVVVGVEDVAMRLGKPMAGGPAISMTSLTGSDTAAAFAAAATSWAVIGWSLAVGTLTVSPSVAESAMALRNSRNCLSE